MTGGPPEDTGPLGWQVDFIVRAVEVQRPLTFLGTSQCWRAGEGLPKGWAQGGDSEGGKEYFEKRINSSGWWVWCRECDNCKNSLEPHRDSDGLVERDKVWEQGTPG